MDFAERSVEDVLAGRLRVQLAGQPHVLPVLTRGQNADWLASLDADLGHMIAAEDDLDSVVKIALGLDDRLLALLYSYDVTGVLPPVETIERDIYPHEVLRAVMEVRLAANPTLAYAVAGAVADMKVASTAATPSPSSPRRRTAGRSKRSKGS